MIPTTQNKSLVKIISRILLLFVIVSTVFFFLLQAYCNGGLEKMVNTFVLISALIIGAGHILLYVFRKLLVGKDSPRDKKQKRRLEKYRNILNYLTPLVLLAMLYHFWQRERVLLCIILIALLLDRINDLLLKNK